MNLLELHAILLTLESDMAPHHLSFRVFSDNVTAVQALKKDASTASNPVSLIVLRSSEICSAKDICLETHKIQGSQNVLADALSRNETLPGE